MRQLLTNLILLLILLLQPYFTHANSNTASNVVSGSVSPINSLTAVSYTASSSALEHSITYEFSNNNADGYSIHIRVNTSDSDISVTKDQSNDGFWGSESVSFVQSINTDSVKQVSAEVPFVTTSTYKARFTVTITSTTPLSSTDIYKLLSFHVENHNNTHIALNSY